jgi:hypothetical protein
MDACPRLLVLPISCKMLRFEIKSWKLLGDNNVYSYVLYELCNNVFEIFIWWIFSKNMFGLSGVILINLGDFNPSFSGKVFTWSFVKVPLIATNLAYDGRRTNDDDGRQVMAIDHMTLWVRWAKNAIDKEENKSRLINTSIVNFYTFSGTQISCQIITS